MIQRKTFTEPPAKIFMKSYFFIFLKGILKCTGKQCTISKTTSTKQVKSKKICNHLHVHLCSSNQSIINENLAMCSLPSTLHLNLKSPALCLILVTVFPERTQLNLISNGKSHTHFQKKLLPFHAPMMLVQLSMLMVVLAFDL